MASLTANLFLNTSGFTSGIEKARAATSSYQQEMSRAANSIKGLEGNIRVLEIQASGYDELAMSMRKTLAIEAQADKLAKSGLITKQKALELLEKQRLLEANIATQKANKDAAAARKQRIFTNPSINDLPPVPLTPEILKQTERAGALAQEARRKFLGLTKGIGGTSMGFLAFSQAVEDAQYGIKGVLNNIPQMILGFGGSMGLAGVISLAAVAAVTLYPHLKRLYGSLDTERLKAASAAWGEVFNKGIKAAQSTYEAAKAAVRLEETMAIVAQHYRSIYALGQDMGAVYSANIKKLESEREITEEILDARDRLLKAQGKKDDSTIEREKAQREIKHIDKQITERKKEQDADNSRREAAIDNKTNIDQRANNERDSFNEELKKLETKLAGAKANFAEADFNLEDLKKNDPTNHFERINNARNKGIASRMISETEEEISLLKEKDKANKAALDAEKKKADEEISALDKKAQLTHDEINRLNDLMRKKYELLDIEEKTRMAEKGAKQIEYSTNYKEEMAVLKARANGDEKELQRLEYKKRISEELLELERGGYDPDKEESLAKAKALVDARIKAEEAEENRKNAQSGSGGGVAQLGSVAKATNILMGRAANDGVLEENRRQTSLLRKINDNTKPTTETTKLNINHVFS